MTTPTIFDFNKNSDIKKWTVVDDIVMGGRSSGSFGLNEDGHGIFQGFVSLENNGGFSSVRYQFEKIDVQTFTKIILKIKGDGKQYQCRIKANASDQYSYISTFSTTGDWQEVEIILKNMQPSYRGNKLDIPNFSKDHIEEIAFLIGNKNEEKFQLLIDKIELK